MQRKLFKLDRSNAISIGTTAIKPYLSICPVAQFGSKGIVVKCTAAIFFLAVDYVVSIRKDPP